MDLQEIFKEEWRHIIARMITDGTLKQINVSNNSRITSIKFTFECCYIKHVVMTVYSKSGLDKYVPFQELGRYLFSDAPCYRNFCSDVNPIRLFFKTVCNTYSTNELQKLIIFTIHDFYYDLRETHLSNVEMVLRDCYLVKYIQKY